MEENWRKGREDARGSGRWPEKVASGEGVTKGSGLRGEDMGWIIWGGGATFGGMQGINFGFRSGLVCGLLWASMAGAVFGQKGDLKGNVPVAPKGGGKGDLKATMPHDTLKGGDGFIPRTVIDSFPRMVAEEEEEVELKTKVRKADLDLAEERMRGLEEKIALCDSVIAVRRADTLNVWPEAEWGALLAVLDGVRGELAEAQLEHADLEARWEVMRLAAASAAEAAGRVDSVRVENLGVDSGAVKVVEILEGDSVPPPPLPVPEVPVDSIPAPMPLPLPNDSVPAVVPAPSGKAGVKGKKQK